MNAIVAVDAKWGIGQGNELLFSLRGDMKHFREMTTGKTILLGRKTLETFPGGRPLPKRKNIVLTSSSMEVEGAQVVHTVQELVAAAADEEPDNVFVAGGGTVYTALLPYCKRVYMTKIDAVVETADTYFPNLDKLPGWEVEETGETMEENGITYRFVTYVNTKI